ncbi:Anthranilate synthase alpha subunit 2, chloroplastic [Porphyridium purpureum]|uniref:anthranilate synthase n=1 Tax=Porphyridium purpureum TaxID=35688 RepID=A0A5J4YL74_PORPP|nr:Anthranilate synthase alpha subunit 2, chloroplastic [Porphyridium purpureum]|eukprot:POR4747..scf261_15
MEAFVGVLGALSATSGSGSMVCVRIGHGKARPLGRGVESATGGYGMQRRARHRTSKSDALCMTSTDKERVQTANSGDSPMGEHSAETHGASGKEQGVSFEAFEARAAARSGVRLVPVWRRVFADQLTPVELFRCLVGEDEPHKHAFLLESAVTAGSGSVGRYSFVGADPVVEVVARRNQLTLTDRRDAAAGESSAVTRFEHEDPWTFIADFMRELKSADADELPESFAGGWVGYGGYDTVRYGEAGKLGFASAPPDDRQLPEMHMGLYTSSIIVDHFSKLLFIVEWVDLARHEHRLRSAYEHGMARLNQTVDVVMRRHLLSPLRSAFVELNTSGPARCASKFKSNMTKQQFLDGIDKCLYHIGVGDAFQIVLSQRFEYDSSVDPFSVYRALRVINPSPYMIYMQCEDCVLVASSPEILCKVSNRTVTNRPLAGTRWRGKTPAEDEALESELLADTKEIAEHVMLVDLGRNDLGRVSEYGTVDVVSLMEIERYSHVMHISSTVLGQLRDGLTSWDALRATLPAGTVSGAPKIRAIQIIDSIEPTLRGPYGGGIGFVSFQDSMNIALALRTMVITRAADGKAWKYFVQAGAGIVADSNPESEYQETINKSMAMARAIDLAEQSFGSE